MTKARSSAKTAFLPARSAGRAGFTLLELSAVVFIIAVLVSLLCAALNHTKAKALRITCMDNMRQLQHAWTMYVDDYADALPLNQTAPMPPRIPISRWTSTNSWVAGNPLTDVSVDNIRRGTLFPYVNSLAAYRCPLDDSTVIGHPDLLRTRSYSMNAFLGGDPEMAPAPKMRYSELTRPDNVFVFIEENQSSAWGSNFKVVPVRRGGISAASLSPLVSTPADRHAQGCNISFADGHIEYWRWYSPKQNVDGTQLSGMGREMSDILRLQAIAIAP